MSIYNHADQDTFEVPEDGTYIDHRGNPVYYAKGDLISAAEAAQFEAFREPPLSDVAEERAEPEAPENRMEPAPSNRGRQK